MKWTNEEIEKLVGYAIASDDETMQQVYEHAHHMMYKEGNHPEFKERSLSACIVKIREYCNSKKQ